MTKKGESYISEKDRPKYVKCLVWDLDNTLWDGVLLEGDNAMLKENISSIVKELDGRGILQSIASKNDSTKAMKKLGEFGLQEYFLYPQVNWNSKQPRFKRSPNLSISASMQ